MEIIQNLECENSTQENSSQPYYYKTLRFHSDTVSQVVFNPNNKQLATSSFDNTILLWDLTSSAQTKPKRLAGHKSLVNDLAISPTGFLLASASSDKTVRIWSNIKDEEQIQCQISKQNSAPVKSVDFSCDSRLIVTGSDDKTVKIINVSDRKLLATLNSHTNWVKCVRFSQDAKLIASSSDDKTVKLWDVNKKILNYTFSNNHNGVINAVRFHPDNSLIGTACFDKKVRLFDVRSKQLVQVYDQHKKPVNSIAFHPSGVYMASTSFDETIKIFDLRNGQIIFTLDGHEGPTTAVNFSSYGDYLATGGQDALVILWKSNLDDGQEVAPDFYTFPIDNDLNNLPPQSVSNSENKNFNSETNKKTFNAGGNIVNYYNQAERDLNKTEDICEDLSKVFEKMVYQLELITNTFKNFEGRLTNIEDAIDDFKTDSESEMKMNNIVYQKEQLENEINTQMKQINQIKNNINKAQSRVQGTGHGQKRIEGKFIFTNDLVQDADTFLRDSVDGDEAVQI